MAKELKGRELATLLVALRYVQANHDDVVEAFEGEYGPLLSADEINTFCEELNEPN